MRANFQKSTKKPQKLNNKKHTKNIEQKQTKTSKKNAKN